MRTKALFVAAGASLHAGIRYGQRGVCKQRGGEKRQSHGSD